MLSKFHTTLLGSKKLKKVDEKTFNSLYKNINIYKLSGHLCVDLEAVYIGQRECKGVYTISTESMGEESRYGDIHIASCDEKAKYIAKWQPLSSNINAMKEAEIHYIASLKGIAPMIREVWVCKKGTIIIMDNLQQTAKRQILLLSKSQKNKMVIKLVLIINNRLEELKDEGEDVSSLFEIVNEPNITIDALKKIVIPVNVFSHKHNLEKINTNIPIDPDDEKQKEQRKKIIDDIFEVIKKLHSAGIVHNDSHLNNFMISTTGKYYVIDFGLSKLISGLKPTKINKYKNKDYEVFIKNIKYYIKNMDYTHLKYLYEYAKNKYKNKYKSG